MDINIKALSREMQYKAAWYFDQVLFLKLLDSPELQVQDLITIARLYIKYQPFSNKCELKCCFQYLLKKAKCNTINDLYTITRNKYLITNLICIK